jgi:hypothetical protein
MMKFIIWTAVYCSAILPTVSAGRFSQHAVEFENDSEGGIVIDWFDPSTGKPVEFSHLRRREAVRVNSFANHTFLVRSDSDNCTVDESCRFSTVVINDNDDQGNCIGALRIRSFSQRH